MFWILGGQGLSAAEAAAISSFIALGTTPGGYHLAKNSSGFFVNTPDSGSGGGMAIGSPVTSGTAGSILYVDASGNLAQENSFLFWDETNNRIILGASTLDNTTSTAYINTVKAGLSFMSAYGYGVAGSSGGFFAGYGSGGVPGAPTAIATGAGLATLSGRGYDGTSWTTGSQGSVVIATAEAWGSTARGTNILFNTTPIGSTTNTGVAVMASTGNFAIGTSTPQLARLGVAGTRTAAYTSTGMNFTVYDSTFTDTSSSGTVATARANVFGLATLAASSTTTYTNASTVYISGAPIAGTNVTLTNAYALYINGGTAYLGGAVVLNTSLTANYATTSTIAIFDGSKGLVSAPTATYPSLTELSYLKGVTSDVQAQINTKGDVTGPGSSTDNAMARYDSTTGKILKDSIITVDDNGKMDNARVTPRVGTVASDAEPTIDTDLYDVFEITAQAVDITSFTTNLSGTPTIDQPLYISITGTGSRAITWGASFESSSVTLPTTTFGTNRMDLAFRWNTATSKWRIVGSTAQYQPTIFRGCRLNHSTTQTIGTTLVAVAFNQESYDTDAMHDTSTNNSRITFTTEGKYTVKGYISTDGNAVGRTQIRLNGTTLLAATAYGNAGASLQSASYVETDYQFSAGDYVELLGYFSSSVTALGGISGSQFSAYKIDY